MGRYRARRDGAEALRASCMKWTQEQDRSHALCNGQALTSGSGSPAIEIETELALRILEPIGRYAGVGRLGVGPPHQPPNGSLK